MDAETMDRLQAALQAEAEAREAADRVQSALEQARALLLDARAERAGLVAKIVLGSVADVAAVDRSIAQAESQVSMFEEALRTAQQRLAEATDALNLTLAVLVQSKAERARADYESAGQAYLQAAQNRNAAASRMNSLERAGSAYENAKSRVHAMITSPRPIAQLGDEMNQHLMNLELQSARRDIESAADVLRTICRDEIAGLEHAGAAAKAA